MKQVIGIIAIGLLFFGNQGCKEQTILGPDLIPKVDNINTFFTDTISMIANNQYFDSINTGRVNVFNRYGALGVIDGTSFGDNTFGKTVASLGLQFKLPQAGVRYPADVVIDSFIFTMPYTKTYGDTIVGGNQTFNIYRSNFKFNSDSNYRINRYLAYDDSKKIGTVVLNFGQMSKDARDSAKLPIQCKVYLDTNLARELIQMDSTDRSANSFFFNAFKGIQIVPADSNQGNTIAYFDYSNAKIQLFTHKSTDTISVTYNFLFDPLVCGHHNRVTRNFTQNSNPIAGFLNTGNPLGDSNLYLQSDAGSSIVLKFPNLGNFPNAIINKAEIEFTYIGTGDPLKDTLMRPIGLIRALGIDEQGRDFYLSDDYVPGSYGLTKYVADGNRTVEYENGLPVYRYRLTLTKTFQKAISSHNNNLKIRLIGFNGLLCSGRSLLGGSNRIGQKAKINLIYTKFK
jgi:hypothetical protein